MTGVLRMAKEEEEEAAITLRRLVTGTTGTYFDQFNANEDHFRENELIAVYSVQSIRIKEFVYKAKRLAKPVQ